MKIPATPRIQLLGRGCAGAYTRYRQHAWQNKASFEKVSCTQQHRVTGGPRAPHESTPHPPTPHEPREGIPATTIAGAARQPPTRTTRCSAHRMRQVLSHGIVHATRVPMSVGTPQQRRGTLQRAAARPQTVTKCDRGARSRIRHTPPALTSTYVSTTAHLPCRGPCRSGR